MKNFYAILLLIVLPITVFAQFETPNNNTTYTLEDLTTLNDSVVTFEDDIYYINHPILISATDTLSITEDTEVRIAHLALVTIEGGFYVNSNTLFTKIDTTYAGFRFNDGSVIHLQGATFEYGGGLRDLTGNLTMINCIVRYQTIKTSTSGAVGLSKGKPYFEDCTFFENQRSGIGGPANGAIAPTIVNCTFTGNNTENSNRPQINLGPSGQDTVIIMNNIVTGYPEHTLVGGISVAGLLGGSGRVIVSGNVITNNRYGLTIQGNDFYSRIEGNIIEDNNTQGNAMQGGSGINIVASAVNEHVILNNEIRGNLWGITTQGNGFVNLGDLEDETVGSGGNVFSNNGNDGVIYAFFNNTPNDVTAQGNCWIEDNPTATEEEVADVISDQADNGTLGVVDFSFFDCSLFACVPPTNLSASDITFESALLSWTAPLNAPENGYEYFVDIVDEMPSEDGVATEETSAELTDLEANTTYYFWVRSNCDGSFSDWSNSATFTTGVLPCDAPTNLETANITHEAAQISWTAPEFAPANGYEYYVSVDNVEPTEAGTATEETSVELTDLEENTTYYFWVRSVCEDESSGWSGSETFTTLLNTSLVDVAIDQVANIYPNPTSGVLNIDLLDKTVETIVIYDLSGRLLEQINLAKSHEIKLDVSKFASGVYTIQISGNTIISTGKFVIQ